MSTYKTPRLDRSPGLLPSPQAEEPAYPGTTPTAEFVRLCLRIKELEIERDAAVERAEKAEEQRDRAQAWIVDAHGTEHTASCAAEQLRPGACDCGLADALADEPPPQTRDFNPLAPITELPPDIQEDIRTERGHVVLVPQGAAKMAMRKLFEFECAKCGKHFEELVEGEHEEVKCPHCGSLESKRVVVTIPAHGKHDSWRVT